MDYEERFRKLVMDLADLIEKHTKEPEEAGQGIHDVNEIMDAGKDESCNPAGSVVYPRKSAKSAAKSSGLYIR